ncbi:MAG: hypothetical protein ACRC8A_10265 [Microcoleaceae cyanobacterium]
MAVQLKQFQLKRKFVEHSAVWLNWLAGTFVISSLLLWIIPPIFLSYNVPSHQWIQGFSLAGAIAGSLVALGVGYKLREVERVLYTDTDLHQTVRFPGSVDQWIQDSELYGSEQYRSETLWQGAVAGVVGRFIDQIPWMQPHHPESVRQGIQGLKSPLGTRSPFNRVEHQQANAFRPNGPEIWTSPLLNWPSLRPYQAEGGFGIDLDDSRLHRLRQQLEAPEYEWLSQLVLAKPLLIWGNQCSGKTSLAGFLALLRMVVLGHSVSVVDPYAHQNAWPLVFEVHGANYDYRAVDQCLAAYHQRLRFSTTAHTSIWDEVTQYSEHCNPRRAAQFFQGIDQDWRRSSEFPILLSQANRSEVLGKDPGVRKPKPRRFVDINLPSYRDWLGNLRPTLRGIVTGLRVTAFGEPISQSIDLEPWMQPEYLLTTFPELQLLQTGVQRQD